MIFKWETEEEKLSRYMKIPPKKKLEWLYEMNRFLDKYTPKKYKAIRHKLREN
ncbi:MAG: hypothetical protein Q7K98_05450 [Candidatus Omnitrophota bacterium]|nr:hypothetical protein [Candidatus Omnitrophota bacterium]